MTESVRAPEKGANVWGQAIAAVAMVTALGGGLWAYGQTSESSGPPPATCSDETPGKPTGRVTGAQLCEALLRPDLSELLGTPAEDAKTASGSDGSVGLSGGKDIPMPSAEVEFDTYTVTLSATYDDLPVAGSETLLRDAEKRTVLGRPAVLYSDRTIRIAFRLDGGDADSGPGVPLRSLMVAKDAKDGGGSFDVTLWRADGTVPDDAVLLRLAEKVLPTVPGWTAGS
ncbi:DUF6215 domain-containing protein [Streptomyces chartreusis]|uniref:DUF6215 domain-containing protein n=1 Tax=Streptomyces chartreusis TaxID=1969 RepID=UPI002E7FC810|nr:DUF6215 domain-containing protein [Streptomyces chartreusis]WSZ70900.1 DUF6215 domain-containing protein [Streptomyces chartreusis]WUB16762.1 DUF6215 domain-containing protein [Streptomyces chartreusis]